MLRIKIQRVVITVFFLTIGCTVVSAEDYDTSDKVPFSPGVDCPRSFYGGLFQFLVDVKKSVPSASWITMPKLLQVPNIPFFSSWQRAAAASPLLAAQSKTPLTLPVIKKATLSDVVGLVKGKNFGPQGVFHRGLLGYRQWTENFKAEGKKRVLERKKEQQFLANIGKKLSSSKVC